ncbi:MAG: site-2 protease family protein [Planctomycetota bacterium]|jgi:Zn-dependent protease
MTDWDRPHVSPWRDVIGRVLGESEDPLAWGFPIGRVAGVRVRVSLWLAMFVASQIVWSISFDSVGPMYSILSMLALLVVVCAHELGHVVACRATGGSVTSLLLWPLGGLEWFEPRPAWKPMALTALGGLLAQLVLFALTTVALVMMGRGDLVVFDLFEDLMYGAGSFSHWWGVGLWWLHSINVIVFVLNLLPTLPLDGARVLEAWLSRRNLAPDVRRTVSRVGVVTGLGILAIGIPTGRMTLVVIGVCCAFISWRERSRMELDMASPTDASRSSDLPDEMVEIPERAEIKRREREEHEQEEADRILEKISREGMDSLSASEKSLLERVSRRKQQETE